METSNNIRENKNQVNYNFEDFNDFLNTVIKPQDIKTELFNIALLIGRYTDETNYDEMPGAFSLLSVLNEGMDAIIDATKMNAENKK